MTSDPKTYGTPGTYTITWRFQDNQGNSVTQPQSVVVTSLGQPTTVTYSGATSGTVGAKITLKATLKVTATGQLLSGQNIRFDLGAQSVKAVTSKIGRAHV